MIRKAEKKDLARIAEIQVFNYRMYFYPIFKSDEYYFDELQVPSLMKNYETQLDSLYVYDDGVVKGFIKVEDTYIARLFVEPVLQNAGIGSKLLEYAVKEFHADYLWDWKEIQEQYVFMKGMVLSQQEKRNWKKVRQNTSYSYGEKER